MITVMSIAIVAVLIAQAVNLGNKINLGKK